MAARKAITQSAGIVAAPFGLPRVEIPMNAAPDGGGWITFELSTAVGLVRVKSWGRRHWVCRGTVAALAAAGLLRPGWCPGIPGNGKTRQGVIFDSTGPRLLVGGHKGRSLKEAHITVCRHSARTFSVEIPMSPEHAARVDAMQDQWRIDQDAKKRRDQRAEYAEDEKQRRLALTQQDIRSSSTSMLTSCEDVLSRIQDGTRFRYADDVTAQINQHLQATKQLLLTGKILPATLQYQRAGNVVFLSGTA